MPEQDPIPPRRIARRYAPGEDDDVPPWASLPPVRPRRDPPPPAGQGTRRRHGPGPGPARQGYQPPARPPQGPLPPGPPGQGAQPPGTLPQAPGGPQGPPGYGQGFTPPGGYDLRPDYEPAPATAYQDDEPRFAAEMPPEDERGDRDGDPSRESRVSRMLARKRRRSLILAGAALVAIVAVVSVVLLVRGTPPVAVASSDLITTFQPGEFRSVPNACQVVPAATVQTYLPGKVKTAAPLPVNGKLGSACNWSVDHQPFYRLLELQILAYAPNGLASGNGSATSAAEDAFAVAMRNIQDPPKGLAGSKAPVTSLSQLGNEAFQALQVFKAEGATTDVAVVVIRYHNVVVTVELNGLEHSNKGRYGPVDTTQLQEAALAFAQSAYAALR